MNLYRKSIRIVGGVLVVYALLVATHLGEFWPFSVYPMFSQAGHPWTRSLVRELPPDVTAERISWEPSTLDDLPGTSYPLVPRRINQNDVANYVSKTDSWTPERIRGLRSIFAKNRTLSSPLLVFRVRGELAGDSVAVTAAPLMLFTPDSTYLAPQLKTSSTASLPPPR